MSKNSLTCTDNRTQKTYTIPIENNAISATAFKAMAAPFAKDERRENETEGGLRVYDPGFLNTATITSTITFIDGAKGYNAHPMAILTSSFAALGSLASEANPALSGQDLYTRAGKGDLAALANMDKQIFRLIGKAITLGAGAYRVRQGRPFNRPPPGLSYTETFLYLLDYGNETDYMPNPVFAKALDVLFILHADHEMNCSTAAVLQTGSSLVDPYSCVASGCCALYGPSHGGANEAVIRMLKRIGSPKNVPAFIEKVKRKEALLFGMGHRVYRNFDPRGAVIRKVAEDVFAVTGRNELLDTALALHDAALADDYFKSRKIYPNIDYFSGLIYMQLGIPEDYMVVMFAIPRVVGWLAHWRQMMLQQSGVKIWRPKQIYLGASERDYTRVRDREDASRGDPKKSPSKVPHPSSIRTSHASHRDKPRESHL